jgi:hypothetical protein
MLSIVKHILKEKKNLLIVKVRCGDPLTPVCLVRKIKREGGVSIN